MSRVLLLLPTTTYRTADFLEAARSLGVDVTVASERPSTVQDLNPAGLLTLDFRDPAGCAKRVAAFADRHRVDAVVGVDEETSFAAVAIAAALGLPHNSIEAVAAARDKAWLRRKLAQARVPAPAFRVFRLIDAPSWAAGQVGYPCVLKPTFLSASRGVIRADDPAEFRGAWERIGRILRDDDVAAKGGKAAQEILVEDFVPGEEVALEGLLDAGRLIVLAVFDKPDPLNGPFFEETIYVTPSRKPEALQRRIAEVTALGCHALGLQDGPIHAELRCQGPEAWLIELAARSIGGLCSRALRFGTGMSLEELILRHALRLGPVPSDREAPASGVMMIPIPSAGELEGVEGLEEARAVAGIEDVTISAHPGQRLVPLPEGSRYLGFIFSRADTPCKAEAALRQAHDRLRFVVRGARSAGAPEALPPYLAGE
jgi:biotin carboxylase